MPASSTGLSGPQSPDDAPSQKLQDAVKAGDPRALYDMASRIADSRNPQRDLAAAAGPLPARIRQGVRARFVPPRLDV